MNTTTTRAVSRWVILMLALGAGFSVAREERRSLDMPIPQELIGRYSRECLLNNEIFLLLRKP